MAVATDPPAQLRGGRARRDRTAALALRRGAVRPARLRPRHAIRCSRSRAATGATSCPCVLVTGGVHGYETSGVHGALQFVERHAADYARPHQPAGRAVRQPVGLRAHPSLECGRDRPEPLVPRRQPGAGVGGADAAGRAAARSRARARRPARDHRQRRVRVPARRWPRATASRSSRARSPTASTWSTTPRIRSPRSSRR